LAARYPDRADDLPALVDTLMLLSRVRRWENNPRWKDAGEGDPASPPTFGDFQIVREIGRGGMGVVYEAWQLSLQRRVALKVLPLASGLDARRLQRFQHEAQAAAQLHHSNIVPVYEVGAAQGVHFYSMQFIDGKSLAELIRDAHGQQGLPTQHANGLGMETAAVSPEKTIGCFRKAAELCAQAAEALDYAHEVGVVHRDIKPANLLLDEREQLWITDFGLAQLPNQASLTMTGDLVGSLRYMSPEQALAKRDLVDHRTDVYGLGATLYELLTLEPVFAASDRQELLCQIAHTEPAPPRRLRPAVPIELETIVLKALAKAPAERYTTAKEMADDLRCYLEHRPISARRPSLRERAAKWLRRHPRVAWASFLILLIAVLGLTTSTWLIKRAQDKAQLRLQQALSLANKMMALAQSEHPESELKQKETMLEVRLSYERLVQDSPGDPEIRFGLGHANHRLAILQSRLGEEANAAESFQNGISVLTKLLEDYPAAALYRAELAACLHNFALFARLVGNDATRRQEAALQSALEHQEKLAGDFRENGKYQLGLGIIHHSLGVFYYDTSRPADAEKAYKKSLEIFDSVRGQLESDGNVAVADCWYGRARLQADWGILLAGQGRPEEAKTCFEVAHAYFEKLPKENQALPSRRQFRAKLHSLIGAHLTTIKGFESQGQTEIRAAIEILKSLTSQFPKMADCRADLAVAHDNLGLLLLGLGRQRDALREFESAKRLVAPDNTEIDGNPQSTKLLVRINHHRGIALAELDNPQEAIQARSESARLHRIVPAEFARAPVYRWVVACNLIALGDLLWDSTRRNEASLEYREALSILQSLLDEYPTPAHKAELACFLATCLDTELRDAEQAVRLAGEAAAAAPNDGAYWAVLGVAQYRAGKLKDAIQSLRKSIEVRGGGDATERFFLAMAYWRLGSRKDSYHYFDAGCRWLEENQSKDVDQRRFRGEAWKVITQQVPPFTPMTKSSSKD
jgi:serine/threonine protein kinase